MEFPNVGEHCSWSECKTLDFLPFVCSHCKQVFCKTHFSPVIHDCKLFKNETTNQDLSIETFVCSFENCNEKGPLEMLCPKCSSHFCLSHRYHDCFDTDLNVEEKKLMWNKPKEKFAESINAVEKAVNENLRKAMLNPKKANTAMKIQLMKLKAKACGNSTIPSLDRIYFLIVQPITMMQKPKAVFVNKNWSLGKVIDSVSSICSVPNRNNQMNCPKLKLFKLDGSQVFPDTSVKIFELVKSNKIIDGETLILDYIDPNEDSADYVLRDCSKYCKNL